MIWWCRVSSRCRHSRCTATMQREAEILGGLHWMKDALRASQDNSDSQHPSLSVWVLKRHVLKTRKHPGNFIFRDCVASLWPLGNVRKIVRRKESIWTWKFHALEGCILFTVPHQVLDINRNAIKLRSLKFRTCKSSCTLDLPGICSFQGSFPMQDLAATWSKDCTFDFKKNKLPKHFPASKANRANECSTDVHKLSPQQKEWKREEKERRRICYDLRAVARTVHLKKVKIWAGWGHIHLKSNKISWFCKCAWQKV